MYLQRYLNFLEKVHQNDLNCPNFLLVHFEKKGPGGLEYISTVEIIIQFSPCFKQIWFNQFASATFQLCPEEIFLTEFFKREMSACLEGVL